MLGTRSWSCDGSRALVPLDRSMFGFCECHGAGHVDANAYFRGTKGTAFICLHRTELASTCVMLGAAHACIPYYSLGPAMHHRSCSPAASSHDMQLRNSMN
jgi:hypothetical protein